jgi:hypothetical protein
MGLETFISAGAKPDIKLDLDRVEAEVTAAYHGHLQAQSDRYRCSPAALDAVLGGPQRFIEIARSCYAYAVEGELDLYGIGAQDDNWLDFASFINQARWDDEFHSANSLAPGLEKLFKLGAIRARLDLDTIGEAAEQALPTVLQGEACGYLSLNEVAFLAQIGEKSVRNATQPNAPDRLLTRKEGSRTVVDSPVALKWLLRRRSFRPTRLLGGARP